MQKRQPASAAPGMARLVKEQRRMVVGISAAEPNPAGGYCCEVISEDPYLASEMICGEDREQAIHLAAQYVASMTAPRDIRTDDRDSRITSNPGLARGRSGVIASLIPVKMGHRLILDDVRAIDRGASKKWQSIELFTCRDIEEDEFATLSQDELASIGSMIIARLRALRGTSKRSSGGAGKIKRRRKSRRNSGRRKVDRRA